MTRFSDGRLTRHEAARLAEQAGYTNQRSIQHDLRRYDLVKFESCGAVDAIMEPHADGDWVRWCDVVSSLSAPPAPARDEEIERLRAGLAAIEYRDLTIEEAKEIATAALQSERAGSGEAVRVKDLAWTEINVDGETFWRARKPFGSAYYIQLLSNGCFDWKDEFGTLDDAKAAAQADYETRIRSALTVDSDRPATGKEGELIRDLVKAEAAVSILMGRVLAYLEGGDPKATSGGERNSDLRKAVRAALEIFK